MKAAEGDHCQTNNLFILIQFLFDQKAGYTSNNLPFWLIVRFFLSSFNVLTIFEVVLKFFPLSYNIIQLLWLSQNIIFNNLPGLCSNHIIHKGTFFSYISCFSLYSAYPFHTPTAPRLKGFRLFLF